MKVSRAPERRGGANKIVLFIALFGAAIVAGVLIIYFTTGFESRAATGDQLEAPAASSTGAEVAQPEPAPETSPIPTPMPTVALKLLEAEPELQPRFIPDVNFGEVLSQGFTDLKLPSNTTAQSWYTFQVNTVSRDITLFFAVYDSSLNTIVRTVKIEGYSQGGDLDSAEVTLFYPQGEPERVLVFDRDQGTMTLTQQMRQPYGPSLFSPELRVSLVNQRMLLADQTGAIEAQLQLDLTGLSDSEVIVFQRTAPGTVAEVLVELQDLAQQIEANRLR